MGDGEDEVVRNWETGWRHFFLGEGEGRGEWGGD